MPVVSPELHRVVALCSSKHIPLSGAATAVARLTADLVHALCRQGDWVDATPITLSPNDA
jgi:LysR family nitrogen assimilation transcriptional regulator